MKVLVATSRTQGDDPGDFTWVPDGELVYLGFVCDRDRRDPDGGCGCGRAFHGMTSHVGTTTAEVWDDPIMTAELYTRLLRSALTAAGYGEIPDADIATEAAELLEIAAGHEVGAVLVRRLDGVAVRTCA